MSLYIPKIAIQSDGNYRYCILGGYIAISKSSVKLLSFAYGSVDYTSIIELFLYYINGR